MQRRSVTSPFCVFWVDNVDFSVKLRYNNMAEKTYRGVAQLVARLLWEQDVGGSSPFTPTRMRP